jgi:hypothetical protein
MRFIMRSACSASMVLRLFDQRHDVAHAEDAAGDAVGLEGFERVHLFAQADEADGLAGDRAHRQGRAAAPVAVHPGQHDAGDADLVVEFRGDVHRVLTGEAVDHQQRFARVGHVAHRGGLRASGLRRYAAGRRCRACRRHSRPARPGSWRVSRWRPGLRP